MRRSIRTIIIPLCVFVFISCPVWDLAQPKPSMRNEDRFRISEAMKISRLFGEQIWKGLDKAPFALILVTDSLEFLINHPTPTQDFLFLKNDSLFPLPVYYRKAVFDKHFLATFPAVNGVNTIVVGTPENTGLISPVWIITVLHEHFHQFVNSSPGYFDSVNQLDLSGGDKTGMWMLQYPFPYSDSTVNYFYRLYSRSLQNALFSAGKDSFALHVKSSAAARKQVQQRLRPADYKYFSFQVWQEGIARYTEYKFLELLKEYVPSKGVASLPDFIPFETYRTLFFKAHSSRIAGWMLDEHARECFYDIGLGEGLLLDQVNPNWRDQYLQERFYVERYSDKLR